MLTLSPESLTNDSGDAPAAAAPTCTPGHRSVAIIGAGFSGSLLALHLLETGPPDLRILLIERTPGFGPGLAFGGRDPEHLLNVRVGNMSAYPGRPRHLLDWLAGHGGGPVDPAAFITRETYGRYLTSMLRRVIEGSDGAQRLMLVPDEAVSLERIAGRLRLTVAMGQVFDIDAAVLAVGNPAPAPLPGIGFENLATDLYAADPWAPAALDNLDPAAGVLLLGTGLTMVDVATSLEARGHRGPIVAISRRGLTPRRHGGAAPITSSGAGVPQGSLSQLLHRVRRQSAAVGWREAVDALRPATQAIWRRASLAERRRFLRHLRPWWDVHRHRMAPAVAERIEAMRREWRLTVAAGRILKVEPDGEGAKVTWRPRGGEHAQSLTVGRIINCTGPAGDPSGVASPLIRGLIERGEARVDPLRIGLEVDAHGRAIQADGSPNPQLFAVGPITKGSFWEIVAVPDIRNQVADLAVRLGGQLIDRPADARRA